MALPLVGAAFGALTATRYLDARFHLANDLQTIGFPPLPIAYLLYVRRKTKEKRLLMYHVFEDQALRLHPNNTFLIFEGKEWTYAEFFACITRVGNWLMKDLGIQTGEVVALDGGNSPEYIMISIALDGIGAVQSYLNANLTGQSLMHCLELCGARYLLSDADIKHLIEPCLENFKEIGVKNVYYDSDFIDSLTDSTTIPESRGSAVGPDDLKNLLYTSGTTGNPKAIKFLASRAVVGGYLVNKYRLGLKPTDRAYTCMPLYHAAASGLLLTPVMHAGATLVLGRRFSHKTFWPEVRESNASIIQYVGELCRYLVNGPPSALDKQHNVRMAWGNGMRPDVWEAFRERFGIPVIHELYAASDGLTTYFNANEGPFTKNSIGRRGLIWSLLRSRSEVLVQIDPDTNEILRDKNGFAIKCKTGEPGEMLTKLADETPMGFVGYYKNQDATSNRQIRNVFKKGDLWFRSGDSLRVDEEGRVYFVDRLGDTFRWKSENVSTNEVSDALGSFPQIAEANVYGIEVPNADGRCGCAAIVLRSDVSEDQFDYPGLARHALASLPRYAVPVFLRVTQQLDYTGTMKMQKGRLRQEGADPGKVSNGDKLYWLPPGQEEYVPYGGRDYQSLLSGEMML